MTTIASGHGIATISNGATLDAWFPSPSLSALSGAVPAELISLASLFYSDVASEFICSTLEFSIF
jgi:hypothetical protein